LLIEDENFDGTVSIKDIRKNVTPRDNDVLYSSNRKFGIMDVKEGYFKKSVKPKLDKLQNGQQLLLHNANHKVGTDRIKGRFGVKKKRVNYKD